MKYSAHFNEFLNTILRRIIRVIFFTYARNTVIRSTRYDMTIKYGWTTHTIHTSLPSFFQYFLLLEK